MKDRVKGQMVRAGAGNVPSQRDEKIVFLLSTLFIWVSDSARFVVTILTMFSILY